MLGWWDHAHVDILLVRSLDLLLLLLKQLDLLLYSQLFHCREMYVSIVFIDVDVGIGLASDDDR